MNPTIIKDLTKEIVSTRKRLEALLAAKKALGGRKTRRGAKPGPKSKTEKKAD